MHKLEHIERTEGTEYEFLSTNHQCLWLLSTIMKSNKSKGIPIKTDETNPKCEKMNRRQQLIGQTPKFSDTCTKGQVRGQIPPSFLFLYPLINSLSRFQIFQTKRKCPNHQIVAKQPFLVLHIKQFFRLEFCNNEYH